MAYVPTTWAETGMSTVNKVVGCICMWHSTIESIPAGWYHCNGLNSTPDMRDRFPVGAGGNLEGDEHNRVSTNISYRLFFVAFICTFMRKL